MTASLLPLSLFVEVVVSGVTLSGGASRLHLLLIVDSEQKCTDVFVRPLGHFLLLLMEGDVLSAEQKRQPASVVNSAQVLPLLKDLSFQSNLQ